MKVIDLFNKSIDVTDLPKALKQAEMFSTWEDKNTLKVVNQLAQGYWTDLANKLKDLKTEVDAKPVQVKVIDTIADTLPLWVREMRQKYDVNISYKLFSKDKKDSPLFGAHSCVRTLENINRLDKLEIGETWDRGWGSPSLTRIF